MAEQNSKYFFRQDEINADQGLVTNIPADLEWAVKSSKVVVPKVSSSGIPAGGVAGSPLAPVEEYAHVDDTELYVTNIPSNPDVPRVLGVRKQEVSQDPQGAGAISVTFIVTDVSNVEYEMRVTKA